eukprot:UN05540
MYTILFLITKSSFTAIQEGPNYACIRSKDLMLPCAKIERDQFVSS